MRSMRLLFCTMLAATSVLASWACTNIIVGKKASVDGSVLVSYSADSYGCYGVMQHFAPGCHPQGSVRPVYDWETNAYKGTIPEAPVTYNVVGNMNEHQVTIAETTFGGREELVDTTGLLDYGSLIYIALQRSRTAREAIDVMTSLVEEYGYCSEGETFTLADPQEAWIMEMVGKGPGVKGAVWVAVRIPDDCVCAHANQSRIHRFMHYDKKECLFAKDVVSFARSKGLYKGKDKDFDFAATYCPIDFSGARACEARVWGFYRLCVDGMDRYFEYASGKDLTATPMDLFYRPNKQLSVQDVQAAMRDQYEGTPLDMTHDAGAGVYQSPYRPRPLFWEHEGKKYFNERPIGTQQSSFTFVAQMRASLPDAIGGVLWFANDDSKTSAYTPVYCCVDTIPACYTKTSGDDVSFSFKSAFWMCNWVANMVYPRFSLLYPDLEKRRTALEKSFFNQQQEVEAKALQLYGQDSKKAVAYLTDYSTAMADRMMEEWMQLAQFLIVKYNDNVVKPETDGVFLRTKDGLGAKVQSVGYPKATYERIIKETDDRFLVPTAQ
ncbi:MAG: C69 family dipeptidase [Prevotellaceae bacterium]|nr:C69 family dipeptidase [Prevotellaceae bacterium]MDD7108430.1 C69 family dipeptidase [Prevotellaceae bacterium]MDY3294960.1 C69 family dipeptidase [Bacteroidaceae bacterium]